MIGNPILIKTKINEKNLVILKLNKTLIRLSTGLLLIDIISTLIGSVEPFLKSAWTW